MTPTVIEVTGVTPLWEVAADLARRLRLERPDEIGAIEALEKAAEILRGTNT